ncbi:MAG: hypothetical protein RIB45_00075 [Marivibrio sp.]|uniref:hypothetical protein n=1 Tax=Marivibrio sp. TaxID=2039719 RepID=UPI0032F03EE5
MARLTILKTNFTAGEIGRDLMGRGDLRAYTNGAARLRNVLVTPTGGVSRRPGLRFVASAAGDGRLIPFQFNTEQTYLLVVTGGAIAVIDETESPIADIAAPWSADEIARLSWAQSADTLLLVHPEHPPQRLVRLDATSFELRDWRFFEEGGRIEQPHHKFADDDVTLQPSGTSGAITLSASADLFEAGHVGVRFRLQNKEVEITAVSSPTQASAETKQTLVSTGAAKDWTEAAFSPVRGHPLCCAFHQDRLVIGGSRDLPNRLWLSKSSDLFNFDLGTGEDDEAIEFAILSDQVNGIRAVFSSRHLQVLTTGAEWMVTGEPLTPTNLELRRQTRIGSPVDRNVPPCDVDGGTIFSSRDGASLREFLFTDVDQAYEAKDLSALVRHLIDRPIDQAYDARRRVVFVVMAAGGIAAVTQYRQEEVTAWSTLETEGRFRSIAVLDDAPFVLVERDGVYSVERLDPTRNTDASVALVSATPKRVWSDPALAPLEGRVVSVLADGAPQAARPVTEGALTLDEPAALLEVGLAFRTEIAPLPVYVQSGGGGAAQGVAVRLVRAVFRLKDSRALSVDVGRGPRPAPFARRDGLTGPVAPDPVTVDKTVRALGWTKGDSRPLWRVDQDAPLPLTVLSVMTEISAHS